MEIVFCIVHSVELFMHYSWGIIIQFYIVCSIEHSNKKSACINVLNIWMKSFYFYLCDL